MSKKARRKLKNNAMFNIKKIITFALIVFLFAILLPTFFPAKSQVQTQPNIIVIRTDDQDVSSMSVVRPDNGELVMKNVKRLIADQGANFTNSFVSLSLCCPSRATFLTGQYAHNHNIFGTYPPAGGFHMFNDVNTIAVQLDKNGYQTGHFGKYLNGYGVASTSPKEDPFRIPPGWDDWQTSVEMEYYDYEMNENGNVVFYGSQSQDYHTDVIKNKALGYLQQRALDKNKFFLVVDFIASHNNNQIPDPDPSSNSADFPIPAPRHQGIFASYNPVFPPSFNEDDVTDKPAEIAALPRLTQKQKGRNIQRYQLAMESLLAVDEAVGEIVSQLEASGLLKNTYIFYMSDNGYLWGEHRIMNTKNYPYEESIRVPLLLRGPGVPIKTVSELAVNVDLAPTIAEMAAIDARSMAMDGLSLLELFKPNYSWRNDFLIEHPILKFYRGVRAKDYVYIEYDYQQDGVTDEREFYNFQSDACNAADPYQLVNQINNPCYANLIQSLADRLKVLKNCAGSSCR